MKGNQREQVATTDFPSPKPLNGRHDGWRVMKKDFPWKSRFFFSTKLKHMLYSLQNRSREKARYSPPSTPWRLDK
ncbi:unnamed protein product [Linum trigynum]|uniref:Uncharacterized protein n=1 Tax=Linum trigynum TaxID=586398 RepID=A0AAV2DAB3_9ROSI